MRLNKKITLFDFVVHALLIIISFCMLYPLLNTVAVSLSGDYEIMTNQVTIFPKNLTFKSYEYFADNKEIARAYANSILYTAVGVLWNVSMTVLMAYPLSRDKLIGRKTIIKFIVFTMFFSGGTIPTYLVVKETGLLDSMWALIIPQSIWTMELLIVISFFRGLPAGLFEAAEIDGASEFQMFRKIALPLSKASIASISLFYFMGHWNSYYLPMIYLDDPNKFPLQLILRSMLMQATDTTRMALGEASVVPTGIKSAVIVITMIPVLLVYPFVQKYFVKGVTIGAIKG